MKSRLALSKTSESSTALAEHTQAVELFRAHGTLWLENVLPVDFVQRLADAYQQRYTTQSVRSLKRHHALVGDHRFMITVSMESPFNDPRLYANDRMMPILKTLLGDQCLISSLGSVLTFPGADAQPIHFDHPPLFESEDDCIGLPPYAITMVVPLIDLNEQTGTTAIWEGSHRKPGARDQLRRLMDFPDFSEACCPHAKQGDVYLMDYRTIHGGTLNRGDQARPILYIVYSRPWFRDAFNFRDQPAIDLSEQEFQRIPKTHQPLFAARPQSDRDRSDRKS